MVYVILLISGIYRRLILMALKDGNELKSMLKIALDSGKAVAIRYPKRGHSRQRNQSAIQNI